MQGKHYRAGKRSGPVLDEQATQLCTLSQALRLAKAQVWLAVAACQSWSAGAIPCMPPKLHRHMSYLPLYQHSFADEQKQAAQTAA